MKSAYRELTREFGQQRVARACAAMAGENVGTRADMIARLRAAIESQDEASDLSPKGAGARPLHVSQRGLATPRFAPLVPFAEVSADRIAEAPALPQLWPSCSEAARRAARRRAKGSVSGIR